MLRFCVLLGALFFTSAGLLYGWNSKLQKLKIELGQTYRNDLVRVFLDKKLVYEKRVTTNDSTGIADVFYLNKPTKPFIVLVEVNGVKFEKSNLKNKAELGKEDYSLLISYDREAEELEIKTKIVMVLYD